MTLSAALIRDLEVEAKHTRAVLSAVPEDRLDWKPHPSSMSLAALAGHLAETPSWIGSMLEDEMDFAAMGDYRPFVPATRGELLDRLETDLGKGLEGLRGKTDAQLEATWTMRAGPKVLMQSPKHEAIRSIAIHHWIHHRGQLTVYLRLLGVPVPPTYGPTADHPSMG